jgi:cytochrome bd-type quinol oxidase subunit 2
MDLLTSIPLGLLMGAIVASWITGLLVTQAGLGGKILTAGARTWPLLLLFSAIGLALALPPILGQLAGRIIGLSASEMADGVVQAVLTAVGSTLGLAISGFPQIVSKVRMPDGDP